MLLRESVPLDMPFCCYFQPVGEGAILIEPESARLTANGQIFSLMKAHRGADLCAVSAEGEDDGSVLASVTDGILTVTLINESYDTPRDFRLSFPGEIAETVLLSSDEVTPYSYFTASPLTVRTDDGDVCTTLPPHSAAKITARLPG